MGCPQVVETPLEPRYLIPRSFRHSCLPGSLRPSAARHNHELDDAVSDYHHHLENPSTVFSGQI